MQKCLNALWHWCRSVSDPNCIGSNVRKPPLTVLETLACFMITSPFLTISYPSLNPDITIYVIFTVSAHTSIPGPVLPLPPPWFTPNSTTAILFITTFISLKLTTSNWLRTLFHLLLSKPLNLITSLSSCAHCTLVHNNKRIEYHMSFFHLPDTYKVLTTAQPSYLHDLIQPPCSTCSSSVVTLARPPTSYTLLITDHSFQYSSLLFYASWLLGFHHYHHRLHHHHRHF